MDIKEKIKYKWKDIYSYIIPTVLVALYVVYVALIVSGKIDAKVIQESEKFDKMIEVLVTFMSIILSVFGFLIPSFLSGKGESETINYFLKLADMKLFATKLKNVVAFGLIDIFISSVLLLVDVIPDKALNLIIFIWLWVIFFFMCSSYRFISLMINLLLTDKKKFVQKAANNVDPKEIEDLHNNIRSI